MEAQVSIGKDSVDNIEVSKKEEKENNCNEYKSRNNI